MDFFHRKETDPPVEKVDFVNPVKALLEQLLTLGKILRIHIVFVLELVGLDLAGVLVVLETLDVDVEIPFSTAHIFDQFEGVVEGDGRRFLVSRRLVGIEDLDGLFFGEEVLPLEEGETSLDRGRLGDGCCGHIGLTMMQGD